MRSIKLVFSLIMYCSFLMGQETKKITVENKDSPYKEIYYVYTSDNTTKHGKYLKLGSNNTVLIEGNYYEGLRDSTWIEYYWGGKTKKSQGNYIDNKKAGVWCFYDYKGELEQKYNFTKNELSFYKSSHESKEIEYKVIDGNDTIKTKLDRPPLFIGAGGALSEFISNNIVYPKNSKENGIQGKVVITFTIDTTGKAINHRVIKSVNKECDKEALRVIIELPDNWLPALLNGKPVNSEYMLPIGFRLN